LKINDSTKPEQSILQSSILPLNSNECIALVCHDAGAANLLISWLKNFEGSIRPSMTGPAEKLWYKYSGSTANMSLDEALLGASILITGTGWSSSNEHEARKKAIEIGLYSISAVDHWIKYRLRFIRDDNRILPDEIWVADKYAQDKILKYFPGVTTQILPNYYLKEQVSKVLELKPKKPNNPPSQILYLLAPVINKWVGIEEPGEFHAVRYFLDNLNKLGVDSNVTIRFRPHPSEKEGKYNWILNNTKLNIIIDNDKSLASQIALADLVVGVETFALVIALDAGRPAMTTMPPNGHMCGLPHKEIIHLKDMI
jgi:hypothetical protein